VRTRNAVTTRSPELYHGPEAWQRRAAPGRRRAKTGAADPSRPSQNHASQSSSHGLSNAEARPGKAVAKRVSRLKNDLPDLKEIHNKSPSEYSMKARNWYSRLRDAYERAVEERIFHGIVQRFSNKIKTMELRFIALPDDLAIGFHEGMSTANTYSHDNPSTGSDPIPGPEQLVADLQAFETLLAELKAAQKQAEIDRPSMKP
jgi:hypothetical protein